LKCRRNAYGDNLLLLEVVRGRFGVDRIVPELLAVCRRWNPGWIALEANGFQVAIVHAARGVAGMAPIRLISHEGKGKLVRAASAIILAQSPSRASSGCRARRNGSKLLSTNSSASPAATTAQTTRST
jgi:hypothetical protein